MNVIGEYLEPLLIFLAGILLIGLSFFLFPDLFAFFYSTPVVLGYRFLAATFPFWGPVLFAFAFYNIWIEYIRTKHIQSWKYVLLEIKLPPEVYKSPLAMELALSGLYVTAGESTPYDVYVLGKTRPWFSLEIASIEGRIHFYIWTREGYRNVVEAQLYGQYPNIEITEVPDYTDVVPYFDMNKAYVNGQEYKLDKPDPYPIKTYVDYGLDKDPDEELKIDPLTSVLEYLGTLKKGEHIWIQILIQAHKKKRYTVKDDDGKIVKSGVGDIQKEAQAIIKQRLAELKEKVPNAGEGQVSYSRIPTKAESEVISAIDRAAGKLNYDCGLRLLYVAKPESFQGVRIPQSIGLFRAFTSKELNGFSFRWGTYFDYPFSDFRYIRSNVRRRRILRAYRLRSWFHGPYKRPPFILSSEELATIFHPVGTVLQVPSIERVTSKKAEAPGNLPV